MSDIVSSTWYADFFTELPNEFWRRAVPPESTEAEIDFIERHLGLKPGSRIIDVPCGSGGHTLALAARGHRLTGVDISTEHRTAAAHRSPGDLHGLVTARDGARAFHQRSGPPRAARWHDQPV